MEADEECPETYLAECFVQHASEHFRPPVVQTGEQAKNQTADDNVVEVSDDEVGIMILEVGRRCRQHNAGYPAHYESRNEADCEQSCRREADRSAPHREQPVEDLDACRYGDQHRRDREQRVRNRTKTCREHMMRPNHEAKEADQHSSEHHRAVSEQPFAREGS